MKTLKQFDGVPEHLDIEEFDTEKLRQFLVNNAQHYPYFIKDKSFVNQLEYRFVWLTSHEVEGFIDIKVPEAIIRCTEPNRLTQ